MLKISKQANAALEQSAGGQAVQQCPLETVIEARKQTALAFFKKNMEKTDAEAEELLKGVDLNHAVEVVPIPPPKTMSQYVRKSLGRKGNWFNPDPKQTPDQLGFNGDPAVRELKTYRTPRGEALRSTAAPIVDHWTDKSRPVSTKGGGIQMAVSNSIRDAFTEVG